MKRYTWRDWWKAQEGMDWFWAIPTYSDIYPWWHPRRYERGGKLPEMWYYLKCRFWKKYSTVTPRDIPPTWIDRGDLLLHTSFEILCEFVEKENEQKWTVKDLEAEIAKQRDPNDWSSQQTAEWCEGYLPTAKEIEFLYHWWTVLRPEREAEYVRRLSAWHNLYSQQMIDYTASNPGWEITDNPNIRRFSLPEDAPEPEGLKAAEKHMRDLDDDVRGDEDDVMLKRLIDIRHALWT
jgi:hypothetical protein